MKRAVMTIARSSASAGRCVADTEGNILCIHEDR
jgi:hypothetical protein